MNTQYFISSGHINAWTIQKCLQELELDCKSLGKNSKLVASAEVRPKQNDVIFFTEEDSLNHFLKLANQDSFHFYPKAPEVPVDDKLAFANFLEQNLEKPVPYVRVSEGFPETPPFLPVLVKARSSWKNGKKIPRGWVCETIESYRSVFDQVTCLSLESSDFLLQRYFGKTSCFSTCGFFDATNPDKNIIVTTEKLLGQGGLLTTGVIVSTVHDPEDLVTRTTNILKAMNYCGPFELEFIFDYETKSFYVLELNMRFWMQHGIFLHYSNNGLIKRYLNQEYLPFDSSSKELRQIVWVDRLGLLAGLCRLRATYLCKAVYLLVLAFLTGKKLVFYPDIRSTVSFCNSFFLDSFRNIYVTIVSRLER
jgi:hypothetical protein